MDKYLVIELQQAKDGTVANIVTSHDTRSEAESKYHTVLAAAAISGLPSHAAVLMTHQGYVQAAQCYEGEEE